MYLLSRCYTKARAGYKYYSSVVRDVTTVSTLSACAGRCGAETFCRSFSFRFSSLNDQDNCLLSGLNTSDILPQSDLLQDRDWDVWQYTCGAGAGGSDEWTLRLEASKLRSGAADTVSAVSGLRACLRRCQDMQVTHLASDIGITDHHCAGMSSVRLLQQWLH